MQLRDITTDQLDTVLAAHLLWLETDEKEGQKADLSYCNLNGKNLSRMNLRKANFKGAQLVWTNFHRTDLSGADLTDAAMSHADLSNSILIRATLRRAILRSANLYGVGCLHTDFRHADLTNAMIDGASSTYTLLVDDAGKKITIFGTIRRKITRGWDQLSQETVSFMSALAPRQLTPVRVK
jgi:uncharacterized protein YjbI with pentapeptide repeats